MTLALVGATAMAAACLQSATGLGFALVLTPVLLARLSPAAAIITVTLLGLELNLLVLAGERRTPTVAWRELLPVLIGAIPGIGGGVLVLQALPRPVLQALVGILVLGAIALRRSRASAASAAAGAEPSPTPSADASAGAWGVAETLPRLAIGVTTGVLTTSSGVSGPPLALWFSHRGLCPAEMRDSLSAAFLALGAGGAVALSPLVGGARLDGAALVAGVACVLAGHAAGRRVFSRLAPRHFELLLLLVVAGAAGASLASGLAALF